VEQKGKKKRVQSIERLPNFIAKLRTGEIDRRSKKETQIPEPSRDDAKLRETYLMSEN